ncbi:hypothetical protein PoB_002636500 [Plakobranchus ocellatus]|uniref:Uncharacterized protein n=1 Tax=Plakobranchus ocellatus TaxID=259542 RepID=A0AAV3ZVH2_9GAST|nr:hypothetical protein PoB_002636500 [Plakobranchus ocellatus]
MRARSEPDGQVWIFFILPAPNKVISGFKALRQARALMAGLELATKGSLQISRRTHKPLCHRRPPDGRRKWYRNNEKNRNRGRTREIDRGSPQQGDLRFSGPPEWSPQISGWICYPLRYRRPETRVREGHKEPTPNKEVSQPALTSAGTFLSLSNDELEPKSCPAQGLKALKLYSHFMNPMLMPLLGILEKRDEVRVVGGECEVGEVERRRVEYNREAHVVDLGEFRDKYLCSSESRACNTCSVITANTCVSQGP